MKYTANLYVLHLRVSSSSLRAMEVSCFPMWLVTGDNIAAGVQIKCFSILHYVYSFFPQYFGNMTITMRLGFKWCFVKNWGKKCITAILQLQCN